jgi:hypothetical protein
VGCKNHFWTVKAHRGLFEASRHGHDEMRAAPWGQIQYLENLIQFPSDVALAERCTSASFEAQSQ